jgi:hypothetical protein
MVVARDRESKARGKYWLDGANKENSDKDSQKTNSDSTIDQSSVLVGTTLKVYRFLYKSPRPMNIHDVQRGLHMSSASLAQYHIKKLVQVGLAREEDEGYVVDKILFENMIRIGRSTIPFQISYAVFFATMLGFLVILWKLDFNALSLLVFGFMVSLFGLGIFLFETFRIIKKNS